MSNQLNLVIDATRKASKFLMRDYLELESLQSSSRRHDDYAKKAEEKAKTILQENLGRFFHHVISEKEEVNSIQSNAKIAVIEAIDGISNFKRALPFFGIMVTIFANKDGQMEPENVVLNFPALGEIFSCEKSKGAKLERYYSNIPGAIKMRVSSVKLANEGVACVSNKTDAASFSGVRSFDSDLYSIAMLISGKVDFVSYKQNALTNQGIELIVNEAGGKFEQQDGLVIATNNKIK